MRSINVDDDDVDGTDDEKKKKRRKVDLKRLFGLVAPVSTIRFSRIFCN